MPTASRYSRTASLEPAVGAGPAGAGDGFGEVQQVGRGHALRDHRRQRIGIADGAQAGELALEAGAVALLRAGERAGVEAHRGRIGQPRIGRPHRQHLRRRRELRGGEIGRGIDRLDPRDLGADRRVEDRLELARFADRGRHLARHLRRGDDEVDVVRIIAVADQALVAAGR